MRRKAVEQIDARRNAIISGLWSNSNYDSQEKGKEAPREAMLVSVDQAHDDAIESVYSERRQTDVEVSQDGFRTLDREDPFFAPTKLEHLDKDG
jgi:hypothetical protein